MKTLKKTTLLALLLLIGAFAACKKDSGSDAINGSQFGTYKFSGTDYPINAALEKHTDSDIFLEFDSGNIGHALQLGLPNTTTLPVGVLSYHADRFQGYDPKKHFWASVVLVAGVSAEVTGGTATISKTDAGYKVIFNLTTTKGPVTGEYNGTPTKA